MQELPTQNNMQGSITQLCYAEALPGVKNYSRTVNTIVRYLHKGNDVVECKHLLTRDCDIYRKFFIMSQVGFNCISNISLVGNRFVHVSISGRALRILHMLSGARAGKIMKIPFPEILHASAAYTHVVIHTEFKKNKYMAEKILTEIEFILIPVIASIVMEYVDLGDYAGEVSWHNESVLIDSDDRRDIIHNPHEYPIYDYRELSQEIPRHATEININLSKFTNSMFQLIIAFSASDDYDSLLPILVEGALDIHEITHTTFTGDSAHELDKVMVGAHVPDKPIYTITFQNSPCLDGVVPQCLESKEVKGESKGNNSSVMNFRKIKEAELRLTIIPQSRPVTVTVIGKSANTMHVSDGMMMPKYEH